jgi:hypothetical protein
MSTHCDCCGVSVSSKGFLGGSIVCSPCAEAKRKHDTDTLEKRIDRFGGGEEVNGKTTLEDLCYGDS